MAERQSLHLGRFRGSTVEELREENNRLVQRLEVALDEIRGHRGTPTFHADVNANGRRMMHLADPQADDDAQKRGLTLNLDRQRQGFEARGLPIRNGARSTQVAATDLLIREELTEAMDEMTDAVEVLRPVNAPPNLAVVSALGTQLQRYAAEDHTHGVDTGDFTITGTGFTVNPTGTARYALLGPAVGLLLPELTGTGIAANPFTLTGIPAAIQPPQTGFSPVLRITDAGTASHTGVVRLNAGSGTWDVFPAATLGTWGAGAKTLHAVWLVYLLL